MKQKSRVARAAVIVMVGFLLAKVTGLARQWVIASVFGTSSQLDAYFAAFTAPDLIFMLISGGALATAFIPIFAEYLNPDKHERSAAWRMASNVLTVTLTLSAVVGVVLAIFAPQIVAYVIAPGFEPENQLLTANLMRLILISTVIFSVSGLVTGVLHSLQDFLLPAFSPLFYNLGIIFGALVLVPNMPEEQKIYGLALGSVIGAALHLAIQVPALISHGVRLRPVFDLGDPGLRQVAWLMAPRAATLALIYSKFIIRSNLASRLEPGSLSAIDFAWDLMQLPETIFATSIALAAFPTMAELWTQKARQALADTFNQAMRSILALTIPSTVAFVVLGLPFVRTFYERGAFTFEDSLRVNYALAFFAFGIVGHGLLEIVARLYYAQKDTLRPFIAAIVMLIVTAGISLFWLDSLGIGAIALGDTVGVFVEVAVLFFLLRIYLPEGYDRSTLTATAKIIFASLVMGGAIWLWLQIMTGASIYLVAAGGIIVGAVVYIGLALALGIEEIKELPRLVLRRG
ncbi:MAG: murein biosynthesis integral membrane protein MurJ [Ardenticatenaceae bacterium]